MIVLGYLFIINGFVRTTIFDKRSGTIQLSKHPIQYYLSCCKNKRSSKIKVYPMEDIVNVRAVMRGLQKGNVNTLHYKIIIDFESLPSLAI
jgi:hypothetical protein